MAFTFERMEDGLPIVLKLKERKHRMILYEEMEDPALLMSSFIQEDLDDPKPVVVIILETGMWEEEKEELWDIDPAIEIADYEKNLELTVPLETLWNDDFLEFGKSMKWFRYSFKNKRRRAKRVVAEDNDGDMEVSQSFSEKLRKFVGIPTEDEWLESQKKKRSGKEREE